MTALCGCKNLNLWHFLFSESGQTGRPFQTALYSLDGLQIQYSDMDEKENLLLSEVEEEIQEEDQCEPKEDEKVRYL